MSVPRDPKDHSTEAKHSTVQVDLYGLKAKIRPAGAQEPEPKSWSQLRVAVIQKLRSICFNVFGAAEDAVKAVRSLVRGVGAIGSIPDAAARRIGRAHALTDTREDQASASVTSGDAIGVLPSEAADKLRETILKLKAKGIPIVRREIAPGVFGIFVVPRPVGDDAMRLATEELKALGIQAQRSGVSGALMAPGGRESDARTLPISALGLDSQTRTALTAAGLTTVGQLTGLSRDDLLGIRGIGNKRVTHIRVALANRALELGS